MQMEKKRDPRALPWSPSTLNIRKQRQSQEGKLKGASRKTAGHGEPASRERERSVVSDAARRAHVTRTENWPLDLG